MDLYRFLSYNLCYCEKDGLRRLESSGLARVSFPDASGPVAMDFPGSRLWFPLMRRDICKTAWRFRTVMIDHVNAIVLAVRDVENCALTNDSGKQILIALDRLIIWLNTICFSDSPSQSNFLLRNYTCRLHQFVLYKQAHQKIANLYLEYKRNNHSNYNLTKQKWKRLQKQMSN